MIAEKFIFQTIFNSSRDVGVKSFETQYLDDGRRGSVRFLTLLTKVVRYLYQRDILVSRNMATLLRHYNQLVP